jgi:DNA-binding XRE family transcriptional regulator
MIAVAYNNELRRFEKMAGGDGAKSKERDDYFIDRLTTFRLFNGWSRAKLAQMAGVDRETIAKMEKHHGVSDYIASKVFAAVATEKLSPEYKDPKKEITSSRRPSKK